MKKLRHNFKKEEKGTMQKLKTKLDVTQRKITDLYLKESKQAV